MKFKSLVTNHIPNGITIIRIILTALLVFLFANGYEQVEIVIVITLLIFISDLVDGKIARKLKATSKVGEFLDVFADLGYILFMSTILTIKHILPGYFLFLVCTEFIAFIITSQYLKEENRYFVFDQVGKGLAVIYYILPIIMYVTNIYVSWVYVIFKSYGFFLLVLMTIIVILYRVSLCKNSIKQIA